MQNAARLRVIAVAVVAVIATSVYVFGNFIPGPVRGGLGVMCFLAVIAACSKDLSRVSWRTVAWGLVLQFGLALLILKLQFGGWRPGYEAFAWMSAVIGRFLDFTTAGAVFVFGGLADPEAMGKVLPPNRSYIFAFMGLPAIVFVSAFFTVLYHYGILQLIVRLMARVMMALMRTSGAETLSTAANVFLGQTEAPLIVKPYVPRMTQSELLAVMVGGLATISGGMAAVYMSLGADPIAILTTSVMAAPPSLYLAKILLPETEQPETAGAAHTAYDRPHVNGVDAFAAGASDGMLLAINVAAMLIAFLALLALVDYTLGLIHPSLSLSAIFARVFAPAAALMGVPMADVPAVADLLGTKLVSNEFVAFLKMTGEYRSTMSPEAYSLSTYMLTGFANFGSIGILLGGIGAMAPTRRGDLARLAGRALLGGFLATMINASMVSMLL
jgi:concentrative nucleoside transporter, CNT family